MRSPPELCSHERSKTAGASSLASASIESFSTKRRPTGFLSFDIEALPMRAPGEWVDRLIWGITPEGECGVRRICRVLSEHKLKATFMVDMVGCLLHGDDSIAPVVDYLLTEGHDVQVHLHSEWLVRLWKLFPGVHHPVGMHELDSVVSRAALDFSIHKFRSLTGNDPIVFRSGGCHFNRHTIEAARAAGFRALSNFNADRHAGIWKVAGAAACNEPFDWGGIVEIPFDIAPEPLSTDLMKTVTALQRARNRKKHLSTFNVLLHSWSLISRNPQGFHLTYEPEHERRLHEICALLESQTVCSTYSEYLLAQTKFTDAGETLCFADLLDLGEDHVECGECRSLLGINRAVPEQCSSCGARFESGASLAA